MRVLTAVAFSLTVIPGQRINALRAAIVPGYVNFLTLCSDKSQINSIVYVQSFALRLHFISLSTVAMSSFTSSAPDNLGSIDINKSIGQSQPSIGILDTQNSSFDEPFCSSGSSKAHKGASFDSGTVSTQPESQSPREASQAHRDVSTEPDSQSSLEGYQTIATQLLSSSPARDSESSPPIPPRNPRRATARTQVPNLQPTLSVQTEAAMDLSQGWIPPSAQVPVRPKLVEELYQGITDSQDLENLANSWSPVKIDIPPTTDVRGRDELFEEMAKQYHLLSIKHINLQRQTAAQQDRINELYDIVLRHEEVIEKLQKKRDEKRGIGKMAKGDW
ncbi:hypothetical protein BZA77DRAFT_297421 [Pyronema omphalodes]|nr:hypothetical protein BZA77DRAFT_297421 [Pyronema omphalodes]